ncbi:hypothetical protein JQC91_11615 [Jannaschia sp. Os4]|uniref:hypothetical protein n=1 Tax=Jannaschia sp. Os4 TaxID=2807617 RepID=UPI00193934A3|nr:hypothetical protein [Jannaschia sp. Os4]MBM2576946.1 hypothetical protein [Jannaschia sp. Os4]
MRALILASLAVLWTSQALALDFTRIASERSFREHVANRTLVDEFGGTLLFAGNGGIGGTRDAMAVSGGWVWVEDSLCRRIRLDGIDTGADCQHLWIKGDQLVVQARRGAGSESVWTVKGRDGRR